MRHKSIVAKTRLGSREKTLFVSREKTLFVSREKTLLGGRGKRDLKTVKNAAFR